MSLDPAFTTHVRHFGPFETNLRTRELRKNGSKIRLHGAPFEVLEALLERPGDLVTREELFRHLWPNGTFVDFDNNLNSAVKRLRDALGDSADAPRYIETLPRLGYRLIVEVSEPQAVAPRPELREFGVPDVVSPTSYSLKSRLLRHLEGNRMRWAATLFVIAGIGAAYWFPGRPAPPKAAAPSALRTIAVLPFRNVSKESNLDYLERGLSRLVAEQLSFERGLTVRSSDSSLRYLDPTMDLHAAARDLQVDTLVRGNYARDKLNIWLAAEIVDASRNQTLWRGTLQAGADSPVALSGLVVDRVSVALRLENTISRRTAALSTNAGALLSADAFEQFLRGLAWEADSAPRAAWALHEKVLNSAPEFGLARAHLGFAMIAEHYSNFRPQEAAIVEKAFQHYQRAVAANSAPPAILSLGGLYLVELGHVDKGATLLQHAVRLNPDFAEAHLWLSQAFRYAGMLDESRVEAELAMRLDPSLREYTTVNTYLYRGEYAKFLESLPRTVVTPRSIFYRGLALYAQGDREAAGREFARAYELNPALLHAQYGQAIALTLRGANQSALALLRRLEMQGHPDGEMQYKLAQAFAVAGDADAALRALRMSVGAGFVCSDYFLNDPLLRTLRDLQQFQAVVQASRQSQEALRRVLVK